MATDKTCDRRSRRLVAWASALCVAALGISPLPAGAAAGERVEISPAPAVLRDPAPRVAPDVAVSVDGDVTSAGPAARGGWRLDRIIESAPFDTTPNQRADPDHDGQLDPDTTVYDNVGAQNDAARPVALDAGGTGAMYFPGWHDIVVDHGTTDPDDDEVHPTRSSVRVAHKAAYNPGTAKEFRVEVYLRPDEIGVVEAPDNPLSADASLNIAQKGVRPAEGRRDVEGQWKVSMDAAMRPVCTFRGDTVAGPGISIQPYQTQTRGDAGIMAPGRDYKVQCDLSVVRLSGGATEKRVIVRLFAKVLSPDGQTSRFEQVKTNYLKVEAAYFNVVTDDEVWIGKKPDDTEPDDTFAGAVDNVTVYKSSD